MIHILLNNKKVQCKEGQTILDVAREQGINIPTLCHEAELSAYASCWVCSVKVEGIPGFVTSCGTKVVDGMSVITDSEEVHTARKTALELLLSDHYADCEAPCKVACPDHVDIQTYVSLIANGRFKEAVEVIKRNLPLPLSVGRVCPAFCEVECRRALVDESVAIRQLKRCASDFELDEEWSYVPEKKAATGKRIAVIGAGPAGLTCGYYLSNDGYEVDIFESAPQAGGWLRYGIPEFRLPKAILDREIEIMCKNGMKIHYGKTLGKDIFLSQLSQSYDAVFMGIGAQLAVPMRVKGDDLKGCFLGVDYLKENTLGTAEKIGKKVAIVGGGNTAIDCARTVLREGADVTLIYRRTRKEMPAEAYEVDAAEEEGVVLEFLVNPIEILGENGQVKKLIIEKMKLGEPDESGRRRPLATGETYQVEYDTVIAAISQKPDLSWNEDTRNHIANAFKFTRWSTAEVDEPTMHWNDNIFAGGDFQRGPATVIEAVADGKLAATSIERYLQGKIMAVLPLFDSKKAAKLTDMDEDEFKEIPKKERLIALELELQERRSTFKEVEKTFALDKGKEEADRCLECGCMVNTSCLLRDYATEYQADQENYAGEKSHHPIDDTHPFIIRDANKCINCGRCIRICSEVQGPAVLGYIYRGFITVVAPEFGEKLEDTACTTCGKCIEVCPTGALLPRTKNYKTNPGYFETRDAHCTECGAACKISVQYENETILRIDPQDGNNYNEHDLCYKGRFAWQNEDLRYHAGSLDELQVPKDAVMVISPKMTNEMVAEAIEFAKAKQLKYVCTESVTDPGDSQSLHANMSDLNSADILVLFGPLNEMLKARARLTQKNGAKLIIIKNISEQYNYFADETYPSFEALILDDLNAKIVFIYNRETCSPEDKDAIWEKVKSLANARVWVNSDYLNTRGLQTFNIPLVKKLEAKTAIIFGSTPDNVNAQNIYRLPLMPFALHGTVISDTGKKIILE
ncbi:MAG: FAD-dependent oxidoreductase [Candidatus Marinimicrobia bacterium]|nr:FAD-dependent oxidoreductase [Candidatus Neomarinimicrobiota bacterium]